MRGAHAVACALCCSACVFAGWGTYPTPSGEGVEPKNVTDPYIDCAVRTPELEAKVSVGVYAPTTVLLGVLVPLIPIFWPWRSPEALEIKLSLEHGSGSVRPDSLRVLRESREYEAGSIEITRYVPEGGDPPRMRYEHPSPDLALSAEHHAVITYRFILNADEQPFSIVVEGLPRIDYVPTTRRFGGLVH